MKKLDIEEVSPGPDVPSVIADQAETYLYGPSGAPRLPSAYEEESIKWFSDKMINFNKSNREQHLKTVSEAYAIYAASKTNGDLRLAVVEAVKKQSITLSARKCQLRIILEVLINYSSDEDAASRRRANNLYSRDVGAIKHLIEQGIPPSDVVEHAAKPGEGLDQWNRRKTDETGKSSSKKRSQANNTAPKVDGELSVCINQPIDNTTILMLVHVNNAESATIERQVRISRQSRKYRILLMLLDQMASEENQSENTSL